MNLLDRITTRYREPEPIRRRDGYWEGMASGAAVLMPLGDINGKRESTLRQAVAEAHQSYATNGIVFAVILARTMLLSQASFKFRDRIDHSLSDLPPRARILEKPWPNGSTAELLARIEQDVSLAGNSYIWDAGDRFVRLPPEQVTIVSEIITDSGGRRYKNVVGYEWDPTQMNQPGLAAQKPQFFSVDEVAHVSPYPDPDATFRGMSWLTPILKEVRADNGFTHYKTQYLDHGSNIQAIKYAQKLRPETIDAVRERLKAKYGGVGNAYEPLVADQGADPVMGAGLKDLDIAAVQAVGEERICAAGGVKPELLGLREANIEQYQPAMRHLGDLTCRHLWITVCSALSNLITVPSNDELWFDTTDIAALQAAETEKAQVIQVSAAAALTLVQAGFTRESIIATITSGDLSLLKPDPNAPTPGVNERETVAIAEARPVTGPESGTDSGISGLSGKQGIPPGGGQTLTKPQTAASKKPMPNSFPTVPLGTPSQNGKR